MLLSPQERRCYFVTTRSSWGGRTIFQTDRMCELFLTLLAEHRAQKRFELHAFVLMPDHIHLLLTPNPQQSLERVMQFVKGRFSYEAKRKLGWRLEVWQRSFYEVQVLDLQQFRTRVRYIELNPVRAGRCDDVNDFSWSSASRKSDMDPVPKWFHLRG